VGALQHSIRAGERVRRALSGVRRLPRLTLRARLLVATALVQLVMLALLLASSASVLNTQLVERTLVHLGEQKALLTALFWEPLADDDRTRLQHLVERTRLEQGMAYMVLLDADDRVLAASGWPAGKPLPALRAGAVPSGSEAVFHTSFDLTAHGHRYGRLALGLETGYAQRAKAELVSASLGIGLLVLLVSTLVMVALSYWLTRHLRQLSDASVQLARGDLDVRLPTGRSDEVGRVAEAFNAMAAALASRIEALAESEAKFSAIADYSYDCELWIGPEGKLIWISPRVQEMFGYSPQEALAMDNFPAPFLTGPDAMSTLRQIRHALRGNTGHDYEFRARRRDGSEFWAAADWRPICDKAGAFLGIRISIRNISQRKEAEQRLEATVIELRDAQSVQREYLNRAREEHARISALLAAMEIGILFVSNEGRVVYSNPAFHRMWQLPPDATPIGRDAHELIAASAAVLARPEEQLRRIATAARTTGTFGFCEIEMADGRIVTQRGHAVEDVGGHAVGCLWLFDDVTHARQTADQLIYLAERDPLTGLYNRHRFNEELARMIAEAQRHGSRAALLFFDLDDFKYINDTFGHRAGDAMLIRVAGEVGGQVRRNEIYSRLGGDEFAILVPEISFEMLRVLAERITRAIANVRFQFEGESLRLTTSLGIAVYPDHADNAEDLIARADTAMYQAKEAGKNAWRIYRSDLDTTVQMVSRLSWNDRIQHALENELMTVQFQGVYATADRRLCHFELLARMRDKDDPARLLMPAQFIPMAEKSGKIVDIDRWVLREAIQMLADMESLPALAVNISGRSFDEPTLPQFIGEQLRRCGVAPRRLMVELTETSAVSDMHDAKRFIEALRHTGCGVCLDDFGTGFSSFAYLKHLHADAVKIDGLFIRDLPREADNQLFVKAIVAVARGLRKTTIAECVEDEATFAMLKDFGVDAVQGYYLEAPRTGRPRMAPPERTIANLELPLALEPLR
jgi:diguanylate cyclase (GGDEF)-like protein/PAS domain S-box-containing protein